MATTFGPHSRLRPSSQDQAAGGTVRAFVRLFGPVVYALARKQGYGDVAAANLMREVLTYVARNERRTTDAPDGDTVRARFIRATRSAMASAGPAQEGRPPWADTTGATAAAETGRESDLEADWERELQCQFVRIAMDVVKREFAPLDWRAFWGTVVDGRPVSAVGRELRISNGTVHVVKCRVLARLREELDRLQREAESFGDIFGQAKNADAENPGHEGVEGTSLYIPCCSPQR